jgi:hypothetical protein
MILFKQTDLEGVLFLKNEALSDYSINISIYYLKAYKLFRCNQTWYELIIFCQSTYAPGPIDAIGFKYN